MEMTEQKKNRMVRNLFRLGLALLVFPWLVFLALRILIEFVGQAAVENVAVMSMTVYFFVAIPVGIGSYSAQTAAIIAVAYTPAGVPLPRQCPTVRMCFAIPRLGNPHILPSTGHCQAM